MLEDQVRIRDASDLFEAVCSRDDSVRIPALQAIVAHPKQAYDYGRCDGRDLIDLLIERASLESAWRPLVVLALACYRDPRAVSFLVDEIVSGTSDEMTVGLANRLSLESVADHRDKLRLALHGERRANAMAAAQLLHADEALSHEDRLLVAMLTGDAQRILPVEPATVDAWVAAVQGRWRDDAWLLLDQQPQGADLLWRSYERLDDEGRVRLLQLTLQTHPEMVATCLAAMLGGRPSVDLRRAALTAALSLPERTGLEVERFVDDEDVQVRGLAISLGGADDRLPSYLSPDQPTEVRLAALRRWRYVGGWDGRQRLVDLLGDDAWQVRGAAVEALTSLGERILGDLRETLSGSDIPARVAAARVALALERDDWLEEHLVLPELAAAAAHDAAL